MRKLKPSTETVTVEVKLPARISAFLEKMADLLGLEGVADLLRYNALQEVKYYVDDSRAAISILASRLNIDCDEMPDNVEQYNKIKHILDKTCIVNAEPETPEALLLRGKDAELFKSAQRVTGLSPEETINLALQEFIECGRDHKQFNGREETERKKLHI